MKKTVLFEFPDDFKFPKFFGQKNTMWVEERRLQTTGELFSRREIPESTCQECPFNVTGGGYGEESECFLTGDMEGEKEEKRHKCPFYGGANTVNYDEC